MKRMMLLVVVLMMLVPTVSFAKVRTPQVYIALGDSLAAGQTPNREIDTGYADLIAMRLSTMNQLGVYTKQLAYPGFTVDDVLQRVQSDETTQLLSSATLITISAGANDLLNLVQANVNAGTLSFSQLSADFALNNVRKKMQLLLAELQERAPLADVYVMGYYYSYPYAHDTQKQGTRKQLELLNTILEQEAEQAGATYVSVYEDFGLDARALLPNPSDVHPSIEGYRVMANAFLTEYFGSEAWAISSAELPAPNPLTFKELLQMQADAVAREEVIVAVEPKLLEAYKYRFGYNRILI